MMKTLFTMLADIYTALDSNLYDDLTPYERGLKDILNLMDTRMSGNDVEEMYSEILDNIKYLDKIRAGEKE